MGIWLATAVLIGALLAIAQAADGPLDDPDPAQQRPGFLDAGSLPAAAPPLNGELPRPGRRAVVFFVRPARLGALCQAVADHHLQQRADMVFVLSGAGSCNSATTAADRDGTLARTYGLRRPKDGGAPVGYAVVDSRGRIRYRTLDPVVAAELHEVDTIVRATP